MGTYEYKVVPAPAKGAKAKGVKTPQARFASTLTTLMNEMAAEGWDYLRADTLPCEERSGLTGKTTTFQNMLVFRRAIDTSVAELPAAPAPQHPEEIAEAVAASATLTAVAPEGDAPEIEPFTTPAEADTKTPQKEVAAE